MAYVIVSLVSAVAGGVVVWLYKSAALAAAQKELAALKATGLKVISKI